MTLFEHRPHPHALDRGFPVRVRDMHAAGTAVQRFNARLAVLVTRVVGSMWCAYAFGLFDLISLPGSIRAGTMAIVAWIAQTFLQLVLLSVIMVGQDVQAKASDARAESTWKDAEALLHETQQIAAHLSAQDEHAADMRRALDDLAARVAETPEQPPATA